MGNTYNVGNGNLGSIGSINVGNKNNNKNVFKNTEVGDIDIKKSENGQEKESGTCTIVGRVINFLKNMICGKLKGN